VNARVRSVLLGIGLGLAPLLLVDLALELSRVADTATVWWALAAYALIGGVVAVAISHARRDPLIPAVASVVLLVALLPALPAPFAGLPQLPIIGDVAVAQRPLITVLTGACLVGAVRGRSG
jgi:ABC-type Co2+ transport system permease subunit